MMGVVVRRELLKGNFVSKRQFYRLIVWWLPEFTLTQNHTHTLYQCQFPSLIFCYSYVKYNHCRELGARYIELSVFFFFFLFLSFLYISNYFKTERKKVVSDYLFLTTFSLMKGKKDIILKTLLRGVLFAGVSEVPKTIGLMIPQGDSQNLAQVLLTTKGYRKKLTNREVAWSKSGETRQFPKGPLPVESHRMCLISPARTCEMFSTGKSVTELSPTVFIGPSQTGGLYLVCTKIPDS